jgi:lipopolysaccharide transport system ATP-binding protein
MSDFVVRLAGAGKMYKIFPSKTANLLDLLGLRGRANSYREFWALRDIDLELAPGERIGIIGRNGAGKTTLLRLITENIGPTEGRVEVRGQVQALLESGGGLHPEFTGRENIRAALSFLGLGRKEIAVAEEEISEFTELGRFLDQPFKTYSLGMQARLAFAISTTVRPEILIVDEILGAGDAYFLERSTARMRQLIESGATVLLVSHALDHVIRFCDETIWLDRGRIVMRGPSMDVVKAYEVFVRELENKRLIAKNSKAPGQFDGFERDGYTDHLLVALTPGDGAFCDVREIALVRDGVVDDRVAVGNAQDADETQSASVLIESGGWSAPMQENGAYLRRIGASGDSKSGTAIFHLWFFYPDSKYSVDLIYRSRHGPSVVTVGRPGANAISAELPPADEWQTLTLPLQLRVDHSVRDSPQGTGFTHWPAERTLRIKRAELLDETGRPCAVFRRGSSLRLEVGFEAEHTRRYRFQPVAVIYRLDGINVSTQLGEWLEVDLEQGHQYRASVVLEELNLGNGDYVVSVALYKSFDPTLADQPVVYDWIDRSIEFRVFGTPSAVTSVFEHPSSWIFNA